MRVRAFLIALSGLLPRSSHAQPAEHFTPTFNVRVSLLLVPLTPLLTIETRAVGSLTVQGETNFTHTHGLNLKWFFREPMRGGYAVLGTAWVRNPLLRADNRATVLPYVGGGYAWALGQRGTLDARAGLGPALNADARRVYPVVKVGAGLKF